jgi:GDP-L-fucose synthase
MPIKLLDSKKLKNMGWKAKVDFKTGLTQTYQWYLENM